MNAQEKYNAAAEAAAVKRSEALDAYFASQPPGFIPPRDEFIRSTDAIFKTYHEEIFAALSDWSDSLTPPAGASYRTDNSTQAI